MYRNYDFVDDPINELVEADRRIGELEDELGDLRERLADSEEQLPRWIPVSERLPEPDYMGNPVGVLAYLPDGVRCIGFCDNDEYGVRWDCQSTKKPTHWMPLPEPPEAKR